MKKIFIIGAIALTMVGCTNKEEKADSTVKEPVKVEKEMKKEVKENIETEADKKYVATLDYTGEYNLEEEDNNFIYGVLSNSLFINDDYDTVSDVLYALYGDFTYSVNKVKKNIYDITFNMKYEFDTIEEHQMTLRADFSKNEYWLTKIAINGKTVTSSEQISTYIESLVNIVPDSSVIETEETVENITTDPISDFKKGNFYGMINGKFIYNTYMINKLRINIYNVDNHGNVLGKITDNYMDYIYLTFTKDNSGYWRISEVVCKSVDGTTVNSNPTEMENLIIEEMLYK